MKLETLYDKYICMQPIEKEIFIQYIRTQRNSTILKNTATYKVSSVDAYTKLINLVGQFKFNMENK